MVAPQTNANLPRLILLAPQGAEYQAVRRGADPAWPVLALPLGGRTLSRWWAVHQRELAGKNAVLLGLAGGLHPQWQVGDAVICQSSTDAGSGTTRAYDPDITQWLTQRLRLPVVTSVTVPQVVTQPQAKQTLGRIWGTAVVEMEGYPLLQYLPRLGMVRVVCDRMDQVLPDVGAAVDGTTGQLHLLPLVWAMLRQPKAALALIQGACTGLARLTALAQQLTGNSEKTTIKAGATDVSAIQR
ncbi:phosphorylase family protein [Gloeomargarita sp.]